MDLALTIAQTNPTLGDVHENLGEHLRVATAAADEGADLVLFPELSLTGYFLRDQVFDLAVAPDDALLDPLRDLSRRVTLVIGLAERAPDGRCFNSQVVLEDGAVLAVHRKVHLVSYGMFDEGRDFAAGEAWDTVTSKHGRFGLFLCEDLWHLGGQYLRLLDRVARVLEVDEIDSLHHAPVAHVEAGDDANTDGHADFALARASVRSSRPS